MQVNFSQICLECYCSKWIQISANVSRYVDCAYVLLLRHFELAFASAILLLSCQWNNFWILVLWYNTAYCQDCSLIFWNLLDLTNQTSKYISIHRWLLLIVSCPSQNNFNTSQEHTLHDNIQRRYPNIFSLYSHSSYTYPFHVYSFSITKPWAVLQAKHK